MCSFKTMIKMAVGIGLLLIVGYVAFPAFQTQITAIAPYLLLLVCPIVMVFMMKGMNNPQKEKDKKPDQEDK
ncbi:MAG: DUF2933 domain-containing protein [Burkholderiaceae bacterium]|uniref:DUF2933 domain-containing protein n=1 Tax=Herminiimonas contaminans TaxID=1111140 RepID=A0ABS0EZ54_9BURK|nr:DUF2933 domain-containing protein [Herminiimonas contaminans]MBF8179638.1 DUF2933 domain-containing protein [Herminiimonas contaminans]MBX9798974.1 DUF2933 domain-containing protein [Burkholderiaceae bacterium]